jgi:predicted aspartyl protease
MGRLTMRRTLLKSFAWIVASVLAASFAWDDARAQESSHSAPLEIVHDRPYVMVKVNGKGPFRFVIDTGTGGEAFVSADLATELALPQTGEITLNDPSGQGGRKVPMVMLESLQIAGVEFTGVKAAVHNLGSGDGTCQGLLGFALFRNYLLTLDYPNHRMALTSGSLDPDGGKSVLPLRMSDGIPVVRLAIGTAQVDAQIDSGGSGLSLPAQLASRLKFASEYSNLSTAHSLSTRFTLVGATLNGDVHLGSYTFKRPFVEINPAFPLANFGSAPMRDFSLTFDQKNRLVRFDALKRVLHLSASPSPATLNNGPTREPVDPRLVPVS